MPIEKTTEYLTTPAFNFRKEGKPVGPMYIRHHVVTIPRSIHKQGESVTYAYLVTACRAWVLQELLIELDMCSFDKNSTRIKDNHLATKEFFEAFDISSRAQFDELLLSDRLDVSVLSMRQTEIDDKYNAKEVIDNRLTHEELNDPLTMHGERKYMNHIAHLAESFTSPADGAMIDTLVAMVEQGPVWAGDVPSKAARADLIDLGLAQYVMVKGEDGFSAATYKGRDVYCYIYGKASTTAEAKANRIAGRTIRSMMSTKGEA